MVLHLSEEFSAFVYLTKGFWINIYAGWKCGPVQGSLKGQVCGYLDSRGPKARAVQMQSGPRGK